MAISKEMIDLALANVKKADRSYLRPKGYQESLPSFLENRRPQNQRESIDVLENITRKGQNATDMQATLFQNKKEKEAYEQALKQQRDAARLLKKVKSQRPERRRRRPGVIDFSDFPLGDVLRRSGGGGGGPIRIRGKKWGKDGIPEISDLRRLKPNAPLTNVGIQGHKVLVNRQVAPVFQAFLRDLARTGYKVHTLYGHADRNIAGTNTPSLHSYGYAIDINPQQNPVTYGKRVTNLPKGIGRLAARYGLAWGGQWNGSKKDTMHFSVPFRGRK